MVSVTLKLGKEYMPDLKKRLKAAEISHNALSKEMGISPSQFSRWANKHVSPDVNSIVRIEEAINRITKRRAKSA